MLSMSQQPEQSADGRLAPGLCGEYLERGRERSRHRSREPVPKSLDQSYLLCGFEAANASDRQTERRGNCRFHCLGQTVEEQGPEPGIYAGRRKRKERY